MNEADSHMLLHGDDTDMLTHGSEHAAVHAQRAAHAQAASHGTVQQRTDTGQHAYDALRRRPSDQERLVRMVSRTTGQSDAVRTADRSAAMAAAKQELLLYQQQQQAVAGDLNTEPVAATACRPPPKSRTADVQVQVHPQALEWMGPKMLTPHAQGLEHVPAVLAHKTAKLYGVYAPTVYSDSTSLEALQLANQVMRRSVLPGGSRSDRYPCRCWTAPACILSHAAASAVLMLVISTHAHRSFAVRLPLTPALCTSTALLLLHCLLDHGVHRVVILLLHSMERKSNLILPVTSWAQNLYLLHDAAGSTLYMDVPETSDLYRWGVSLGFTGECMACMCY